MTSDTVEIIENEVAERDGWVLTTGVSALRSRHWPSC